MYFTLQSQARRAQDAALASLRSPLFGTKHLTSMRAGEIIRAVPMPARQLADPPPSLHERAAEDLRFIRGAMERSASFTAVPGLGGMLMGLIALTAAAAARGLAPPVGEAWLAIWLGAAALAAVVGGVSMQRKAAREGASLLQGPGRRFLLGLCPSILAGALLTAALARSGQHALLPATWLLLYGAGVVAAGAFSHLVVPLTGAAFLLVGAAALAAPAAWGDALMAAGFGGIHLVSGFVVWRRHGG